MRFAGKDIRCQGYDLGAEIGEARFGALSLAGGSEEFSGCKDGNCAAVDETVEESFQGIVRRSRDEVHCWRRRAATRWWDTLGTNPGRIS